MKERTKDEGEDDGAGEEKRAESIYNLSGFSMIIEKTEREQVAKLVGLSKKTVELPNIVTHDRFDQIRYRNGGMHSQTEWRLDGKFRQANSASHNIQLALTLSYSLIPQNSNDQIFEHLKISSIRWKEQIKKWNRNLPMKAFKR